MYYMYCRKMGYLVSAVEAKYNFIMPSLLELQTALKFDAHPRGRCDAFYV